MPPRPRPEPGGLTELDRLDPAPVQPPPPRPPRRRRGPVERGVAQDLQPLPDGLRKGAIAAAALRLAMELDAAIVIGRDAAGHAREIRQCIAQLREWAPGSAREDRTDEVRERRERRMELAAGE